METDGRITRIGDGLFIEIKPELLRESGISEGQAVRISSETAGLKIRPAGRAQSFASDFTARYDEALRNLSSR